MIVLIKMSPGSWILHLISVWSFRATVLKKKKNTICSKEKVLFTFNPFNQYGFFPNWLMDQNETCQCEFSY